MIRDIMRNYHRTAISRKKPSAPALWIHDNIGFDANNTLDYGCGRGDDLSYFRIDGYDPNGFYFDAHFGGKYNTILCTYVLNVIPSDEERQQVINQVKSLLSEDGVAYFSVRADKKNLNGWTDSGTYQTYVELDYPVVVKTSNYVIYKVTK